MRSAATLYLLAVLVVAGCGGSGDAELVVEPEPTEASATTPSTTAGTTDSGETSPPPGPSTPSALPASQREEIASQAADTAAAIARWDEQLAACTSGTADDADATCTHASWGRLVFQADLAVYYLLRHLREMPRGACHDGLSSELDALRGFWQGGAPLDLAWLDEQQRPPSLYDLETAVALIRPVPARIRDAVSTVCAA